MRVVSAERTRGRHEPGICPSGGLLENDERGGLRAAVDEIVILAGLRKAA